MNNIDSNENIVTFVHILSSFNGKIILIAKIDKQSYLHGINMKNPNRKNEEHGCTVEPPLRGHPDERSTPLERPLDNVNLNINVLISSPDERPPLLKGYISGAKWVASQEGFHCTYSLV